LLVREDHLKTEIIPQGRTEGKFKFTCLTLPDWMCKSRKKTINKNKILHIWWKPL